MTDDTNSFESEDMIIHCLVTAVTHPNGKQRIGKKTMIKTMISMRNSKKLKKKTDLRAMSPSMNLTESYQRLSLRLYIEKAASNNFSCDTPVLSYQVPYDVITRRFHYTRITTTMCKTYQGATCNVCLKMPRLGFPLLCCPYQLVRKSKLLLVL